MAEPISKDCNNVILKVDLRSSTGICEFFPKLPRTMRTMREILPILRRCGSPNPQGRTSLPTLCIFLLTLKKATSHNENFNE
jgi:hypothetical protein